VKASALLCSMLVLVLGCGSPAAESPVVEEPAPVVAEREQAETVPAEPEPEAPAIAEGPGEPEAEPAEPAALPSLYDFWATWCLPCRQQKPIIDELRTEYAGVVDVIAIDVDEEGELAQRYEVKVIPTLVILDAAGNEVERFTGLTQKDKLVERFRAHGFIE